MGYQSTTYIFLIQLVIGILESIIRFISNPPSCRLSQETFERTQQPEHK